jgi:hypothetical protein
VEIGRLFRILQKLPMVSPTETDGKGIFVSWCVNPVQLTVFLSPPSCDVYLLGSKVFLSKEFLAALDASKQIPFAIAFQEDNIIDSISAFCAISSNSQ